jgi:hypothetical protein
LTFTKGLIHLRELLGRGVAFAGAIGRAIGSTDQALSQTGRREPKPLASESAGAQHVDHVSVSLTVNNRAHTIQVEHRMTLLDALREKLALTGTKKGCDRGEDTAFGAKIMRHEHARPAREGR